MDKQLRHISAALALLAALSGCGEQDSAGKQAASPKSGGAGVKELAAAVVTAPAPAGAAGVAAVRSAAKHGDSVIVSGRIKDFVEGAAVFTIVDRSLKDCKERGDGCSTPWDYCCEPTDTLTSNTATIKIVGSDSAVIRAGVKGVGGIDHLVDVAAEGIARLDPQGNLTVEARRVYVARP